LQPKQTLLLGGLSADGLREQVKASLEALCVKRLDLLYLHQPDTRCGLSETLSCMNELIQEGKVSAYGLSNYSAVETKYCVELCQLSGWTLPSVYQGVYNPLNRCVEDELFPILREHGIRFLAYSPLAGGLLSKSHCRDKLPQKRVEDNPYYFGTACLDAAERICAACVKAHISVLEATYCWLLYHSALCMGDGIVLGASSASQLKQNLAACEVAKPLPDDIVAEFAESWIPCKMHAYQYWRLYSLDMPNRDALVKEAPGALFHCTDTAAGDVGEDKVGPDEAKRMRHS